MIEIFGLLSGDVTSEALARYLLASSKRVIAFDDSPQRLRRLVELGAEAGHSIQDIGDRATIVVSGLSPARSLHAARTLSGALRMGMFCTVERMPDNAFSDLSGVLGATQVKLVEGPLWSAITAFDAPASPPIAAGSAAAVARLKAAGGKPMQNLLFAGEKLGSAYEAQLASDAISLTLFIATCEALVVGVKAGLDAGALLEAINISSGVNYWTRDVLPAGLLDMTDQSWPGIANAIACLRAFIGRAQSVGAPADLPTVALKLFARGQLVRDGSAPPELSSIIDQYEAQAGISLKASGAGITEQKAESV